MTKCEFLDKLNLLVFKDPDIPWLLSEIHCIDDEEPLFPSMKGSLFKGRIFFPYIERSKSPFPSEAKQY